MTREQEAYNVSTWKGIYKSNNQKKSFSEGFVAGAEWADQHPKSSWISVEERLPELFEYVLCTYKDEDYVVDMWVIKGEGDNATTEWKSGNQYTHWMPIPPLPKGCKQ